MNPLRFQNGKIIAMVCLILAVSGQSKAEPDKCLDDCGGMHVYGKEIFAGNSVCYIDPSTKEPHSSTKCVIECEGNKPAEDQTKCFCDFCKGGSHKFFCKEPGPKSHITKEDCEKDVCSGNGEVKSRNDFCDPENQAEYDVIKQKYGIK